MAELNNVLEYINHAFSILTGGKWNAIFGLIFLIVGTGVFWWLKSYIDKTAVAQTQKDNQAGRVADQAGIDDQVGKIDDDFTEAGKKTDEELRGSKP